MSSVPSLSPSTQTTPADSALATPADVPTPPEPICTPLHAAYCFDVLDAHLHGREPADVPFHNADDSYALFVTWNTVKHGHRSLRGCIGNFSPMPLAEGLREYALVSALNDHRFSPIRASELPHLAASVSLLTPFAPAASPLAWDVGTHGLHITFRDPASPARSYSATYLPEVAGEQGWDREAAVMSLIRKAGYRGKVRVGDAVWETIRAKTYESVKAAIDYKGYKAWKEGKAV
ncbi:hypothetical protein Q5752_003960 [Cryptotrichosporon argae]